MNDLFRFLLLRPADIVPEDDINVVIPSFAETGKKVLKSGDGLAYGAAAGAAAQAARTGTISANALDNLMFQFTGKSAAAVAAEFGFADEAARLRDSLAAMKLQSSSLGGDAPGLAQLIQGYDIIKLAASGKDPIKLRTLAIQDFAAPPTSPPSGGNTTTPPPPPTPPTHVGPSVREIDEAISALKAIPITGFHGADIEGTSSAAATTPSVTSARIAAGAAAASDRGVLKQSAPSEVTQPWLLSDAARGEFTTAVTKTMESLGVDLKSQSLPQVLNALHQYRVDLQTMVDVANLPKIIKVFPVGGGFDFVGGDSGNDPAAPYVGDPAAPVPTEQHGEIRPVGVGDLLIVKEHTLRYEGGELAHVENVLKSEHLSRETRRLERTETTVLQETETTKEEIRDTQTTDRFSLKRETSDTISREASLKGGLSVDQKYGPTVEVKANTDLATSVAIQSATSTAAEFSKDVVARSVSSLVERVLERRTTTTISEFEEKYSHGFENSGPGSENISGFYQWIDKVMQAQIYNYGKRLLFDVTVPEPGTNYILSQTTATNQGQTLEKPPRFTLLANEITESNYRGWAALYEVTGLEPPPPPVITISKAYDAALSENPPKAAKSDTVAIEDGYRAKYAVLQRSIGYNEGASFQVIVGSNFYDAFGHISYLNMAGEVGAVPLGYLVYNVVLMTLTIEIFCERTETAFAAWQLKTHAAITQGYAAKKQAFDTALTQAKAAAGVVISGRNPGFNAQIVTSELRRQSITLLTAQQFEAFGALELSPQGFAQPNLARVKDQMPYVRFFEQAFEWEHMTYVYYPYFWGWKDAWLKHMLLDDVDPKFADFLRAGAVRVVFPVRPGFEAAVVHYLEHGKIWDGGPPPDITGSLYVPIVTEIQASTGAPGDETPVGDPWHYTLPTTLVQLRPHNDLPAWEKVDEEWRPAN
jgi:hypothetical protein